MCKPIHPSNLGNEIFYFLISLGCKDQGCKGTVPKNVFVSLPLGRISKNISILFQKKNSVCSFSNFMCSWITHTEGTKKIIPAHKAWSVQSENRNTIPLSWPTMWHNQQSTHSEQSEKPFFQQPTGQKNTTAVLRDLEKSLTLQTI